MKNENNVMPEKTTSFTADQWIDKDFWRSALLLEKKQPLLCLKWQGPIAYFVFGNRARCQEIADQYFLGSIDTNARCYVDCLKRLKDALRSSQHENGNGNEPTATSR